MAPDDDDRDRVSAPPGDIAGATGSRHTPDMNDRVTRLEVEFEHVRKDLDEIKADQKQILRGLGEIRGEIRQRPTTAQFYGMVGTVAVIALTIVLVILGGLAYLSP